MATKEEIAAELALLKEDRSKIRTAIRKVLETNQGYTLDTSQNRQVVTYANLDSLRLLLREIQDEIKEKEAELDDAEGRTTKTSTIIPGW